MKYNVSKKIVSLLVSAIITSGLFGAEITFVPNTGFSLYSIHNYEQKNIDAEAHHQIADGKGAYLVPTPSLGLDMSFTNEGNGFTFLLNNNFSLPTKLYVSGGFGKRNEKLHGFVWNGQMILGYTYGVNKNMQFTGGAGLGLGLGRFNTEEPRNYDVVPPYYNIGLALNFSYKHYFTDKVGLYVSIDDLIGLSAIYLDRGKPSLSGNPEKTKLDGMLGLGNVFNLKIGVAFRL